MSKIQPLPEHVIAAIAAGEIAERPAIIVKELVENAIDAKATEIGIHLTQAGLTKIVVTDNGHGMDPADLVLAVQRHTTSKIFSTDDLERVSTFGFRGEALASIASVATLTIQSKVASAEVGYQLVVDNGHVQLPEPVGLPNGTTVSVESLFAQLPGRRKFLKQPATELKHIVTTLVAIGLSHPQLGIQVTNNHNLVFHAPPHQTLAERIDTLLGSDLSSFTIPISYEQTYFGVQGYVGLPQLARRSHQHQFLFINNRFVTHPPITRAIKDSFGSLLEPKAEPLVVIHVSLPQPLVDVNVHPRKETVKFLDETQILEVVRKAVNQALEKADLTYRYQAPDASTSILRDKKASIATGRPLREMVDAWQLNQESSQEIVQLHHTYLLTQTANGMLIVDQHAAHERILYEQFLAAFTASQATPQQQSLSANVMIELSVTDAQVLTDNLDSIQQIGFEIETFGSRTFRITAVPTLLADRDIKQLMLELIDDLEQNKPVTGLDSVAQRTLAYLACRQAVKAGDYLSPTQRAELLRKLAQTTSHFTCPHGRPVSVTVALRDFEKIFKRSGF